MWTYHAPKLSPAAVADVFASTMFEEEREVGDMVGCWSGHANRNWQGTFRLVGGRRVYRLRCDAEGRWTVEPDDNPDDPTAPLAGLPPDAD